MGLLTRLFAKREPAAAKTPAPQIIPEAPVATGSAVETALDIPKASEPVQDAAAATGVACPECAGELTRTEGSPVSPYLDQYHCGQCGWRALACGSSGCEGYLTAEEMGYANTVRYNCVTCGWTGTGTRY